MGNSNESTERNKDQGGQDKSSSGQQDQQGQSGRQDQQGQRSGGQKEGSQQGGNSDRMKRKDDLK